MKEVKLSHLKKAAKISKIENLQKLINQLKKKAVVRATAN